MERHHAIVWIDHQRAVVWNFTDDVETKTLVRAPGQFSHTHLHGSGHRGSHETGNEIKFFHDVAQTLANASELLIIGPAHTKEEFAAFLRAKVSQIGAKIVAVETADHPTDAQLLAYAKKHFGVLDRMI